MIRRLTQNVTVVNQIKKRGSQTTKVASQEGVESLLTNRLSGRLRIKTLQHQNDSCGFCFVAITVK